MKKKLIKRELFSKLINWLDQKEIFIILGPRQSGKTTLLQMIADYLKEKQKVARDRIFYFSFEDPQLRLEFSQNPKEFIETKIDQKEPSFFFFDEYHWIEEGGQKLKLLYDSYPLIKFFVTGSSSLELTFKTGKYLVGRAFYFHLYPLSFLEFVRFKESQVFSAYYKRHQNLEEFLREGKDFKIEASIYEKRLSKLFEEYALFGGYPEVVKKETTDLKLEVLKNIVSTYLERDIRSLLLIADLDSYQTLLKILAAQTGQILNYQQLSASAGLYFKLLKKYLKILEETFVLKPIKPFHHNLSTELKKNPKIYFLDSGLRNFLISNFASLLKRPDKGFLVESVVFANLNLALESMDRLNFWRTKGGAEIDFILNRRERIVPLEVKFVPLVKPRLSPGFYRFLEAYKPKKGLVLTNGGGQQELKVGKSKIIFLPVWYL